MGRLSHFDKNGVFIKESMQMLYSSVTSSSRVSVCVVSYHVRRQTKPNMIKHLRLKPAQPQSLFLVFLIALSPLICIAMSDSAAKPLDSQAPPSSPAAAVHIVYTEKPQDEDPEAYHIRTLSAVLGSEEAAKEALLYSYKSAASGFSAKLTPEQVAEISKQPGVLQAVPSRTLQLHSGPNNLQ